MSINASPETVIPKLIELHKCIRAAVAGAVEGLKWGMPPYSYQKILVTFAVFKNHIGFAPMPSAIAHFAKELGLSKRPKVLYSFRIQGSCRLVLSKGL